MEQQLKCYDCHVSFKQEGRTTHRKTYRLLAPDFNTAVTEIAQRLDDDGHGLDCEITLVTERKTLTRDAVTATLKKLSDEFPGLEAYIDNERVV